MPQSSAPRYGSRMDALINLSLQAALLVLAYPFTRGLLFVLVALYGVGSGWPDGVSGLCGALGLGCWVEPLWRRWQDRRAAPRRQQTGQRQRRSVGLRLLIPIAFAGFSARRSGLQVGPARAAGQREALPRRVHVREQGAQDRW